MYQYLENVSSYASDNMNGWRNDPNGTTFAAGRLVWIILACFLILPAVLARAEQTPAPCTFPSYNPTERPDPAGTPTRVSVGLYVVDVLDIDAVEQTITVDFHVRLVWKDPRLARVSPQVSHKVCLLDLDQVWNPTMRLIGIRGITKTHDPIVAVDPEGTVKYAQRSFGVLSSRLQPSEFPFDDHVLKIGLVTANYGPDEVVLIVDDRITGQPSTFTVPDWSIGPGNPRVGTYYFEPQDRDFSRFDYEFGATRHSGYYIWKVLVPLAMIVFMSWLVFWIDPVHFGTQVSISMLSMLSLIAYQFAIGNLLPRVSYLTRVDVFVLGSSILVFLALVEAVTSGALAGRGKQALAHRLDQGSRVVFPVFFVILLTFAFWL